MSGWVHAVDDIALWITIVLGGLAAIGAAMRWIVKRIQHVIVWAEKQADRLERVDELAKELQPNHGTSMKDVTDQTAAAVAELKTTNESIQAAASDLRDKFSVHLVQAAARDTRLKAVEERDDVRDKRLMAVEAAVIYLAEGSTALDDMAEALPIIARSTPHECDAPHRDDEDPAGP